MAADAIIHLDSQLVILFSEYFYLYLPKWYRGLTLFLRVVLVFFFRYRYVAETVSPYVTAQCSHPRSNSPRSAPRFPWGGCNPCLTAPWRYCEHLTAGCWSVEALFPLVLWMVHIKKHHWCQSRNTSSFPEGCGLWCSAKWVHDTPPFCLRHL